MQTRHRASRRPSAGFSLVELLISMVIGLVVIGAMSAAYVGSGVSSRNTRAMSQITEDASIAFSVLRSAIAATSYINPVDSDASGNFVSSSGNGRNGTLRGCSSAFSDLDAALTSLACDAEDGPDAIAVSYEADNQNSAVNAAGNPLDCLGNEVPSSGAVRPAYQRFFVQGGSLRCRGPGNAADQALVDNVVDMRVTYGVGHGSNVHRVGRYLDAEAIHDGGGAQTVFDNVLSVRVCITVASADNVLDAATPYIDCTGATADPPGGSTDRRMLRSFTTTVVLQNRLEGRS